MLTCNERSNYRSHICASILIRFRLAMSTSFHTVAHNTTVHGKRSGMFHRGWWPGIRPYTEIIGRLRRGILQVGESQDVLRGPDLAPQAARPP
jgi:hypothetical protein